MKRKVSWLASLLLLGWPGLRSGTTAPDENPATLKEQATLKGHTDAVLSGSWSPDGKTLASSSADQTIRVWEVATGKERTTLKGHKDGVLSVSWSPDGKTLASASQAQDMTIKLWDAATGQEKAA